MLRSLSARLTLSYAVVVFVLLCVVAALLVPFAFGIASYALTSSMQAAAMQTKQIIRLHPNEYPYQLIARVDREVHVPNIRVRPMRPPLPPPGNGEGPRIVIAGVPGVADAPRRPIAPTSSSQRTLGTPRQPNPPVGSRDLLTPRNRIFWLAATSLGLNPTFVIEPKIGFIVLPTSGAVRSVILAFVGTLLAYLVLSGIGSWLLGRYITKTALAPMRAVTTELERFAQGDFSTRAIATNDRSEIGLLARAYNGAAVQVTAAFDERRRVEAYMRQFVADAAHELRTPLTVVMGYLQVLQRANPSDAALRTKAFTTIEIESRRMKKLIDRLVVLARLERPEDSSDAEVDMNALLESVVTALPPLAGASQITIDAIAEPLIVRGEAGELHEALMNLLENAVKYGEGSPIEITTRREDDHAIISVTDHGPGIPPDDQPKIFERFFRGERRGEIEGSGLGLAIAQHAVRRAHGTLVLTESRPGQTTFTMRFAAKPATEEILVLA